MVGCPSATGWASAPGQDDVLGSPSVIAQISGSALLDESEVFVILEFYL